MNQSSGAPDGAAISPIVIRDVTPQLDCGRYPIKRVVGETLTVQAEIFRDGHAHLAGVLKVRAHDQGHWHEYPLHCTNPGLDRWQATTPPLAENTTYRYTLEAWTDAGASWAADVRKKRAAGQDIALDLAEGRELLGAATQRAQGADADALAAIAGRLDAGEDAAEVLLDDATLALAARWPDRSASAVYGPELEVVVDRPAARFASWYEMFPRSQGTDPTRSATFAECAARLPAIAAMGFDVVYLVPIHPIGRKHRKGRNNAVTAQPGEPGSPYAIGATEGGHDAVHPDLGTLDDFRAFVARAGELGMEVALDFAVQCAPDHPWVAEHPEWFRTRADGTIRYAENPPKKYQDIVSLDLDGPHRYAIWQALRAVVQFWVDQGVKTFRVDNPHTKPVPLWEWLIRSIRQQHPEVVFLSEAFTRPPMLKMLARAGFTQSYTYFTWRNSKQELTEYLTELTRDECREYLRPNFFANTPDILPHFLQTGGPAAFRIRAVLAGTLSPVYGIYNGFELCEATAVPGTEEYQDSEKYQYKVWDWDRPGNLVPYLTALNRARRASPALQQLVNLHFLPTGDDRVLAYLKISDDGHDQVAVVVNLDPHHEVGCAVNLPPEALGAQGDAWALDDLLGGARLHLHGHPPWLHLTPEQPAVILRRVVS